MPDLLNARTALWGGRCRTVESCPIGKRQTVEAKQAVVEEYALELRRLELRTILSAVPGDPGPWPLAPFEALRDGVLLKPCSMRRWHDPERVLIVVQPEYRRGIYRPVAAGFALQDGRIEEMPDDDWAEFWH